MTSTATESPSAPGRKGLVFEIQKLSTEDGPGIRTTVFLKECPLRCAWCHNPESIPKEPVIQWFHAKCIGCESCIAACPNAALTLDEAGLHIDRTRCQACGACVEACPSGALKIFGEKWTVDALLHEVAKDRAYYAKSGGGVTLSGGEPTLQQEFALAFLRACKGAGISTALDTCGQVSRRVYEKLLPQVDLVLYDLKEIDSAKHEQFTGVPNDRILENCRWLTERVKAAGKQIWIRTPLIPRYTATDENVRGIAAFIVETLDNAIDRWDLLAFNNLAKDKYTRMDLDWDLKHDLLLTKADMEHFLAVAEQEGVRHVQWSGMTREPE